MPNVLNGGDSIPGSSEPPSVVSTDSERTFLALAANIPPRGGALLGEELTFLTKELSDFLQGKEVSETFKEALNKKMLELVKLIREGETNKIVNNLTTVEPPFFKGKSSEIEFNSFFTNQYLEKFLSDLKDESKNAVIMQDKTKKFLENLSLLSKKTIIEKDSVDQAILKNLSGCINQANQASQSSDQPSAGPTSVVERSAFDRMTMSL